MNKGGGSGSEAMRYLTDKPGDAHTIMATLNSYYTTPLRTDIGVDIYCAYTAHQADDGRWDVGAGFVDDLSKHLARVAVDLPGFSGSSVS